MIKLLFTLSVGFLLSFTAKSQGFLIDSDFYDELNGGNYAMHFTGHATFSDSMKVYYSVKTTDSIPQLLFLDSVDFTADPVVFPASFSYNSSDSLLQVNFGDYPTKSLILELYSTVNGETLEHIYINIYTLETIVEDEE